MDMEQERAVLSIQHEALALYYMILWESELGWEFV